MIRSLFRILRTTLALATGAGVSSIAVAPDASASTSFEIALPAVLEAYGLAGLVIASLGWVTIKLWNANTVLNARLVSLQDSRIADHKETSTATLEMVRILDKTVEALRERHDA